jgi:hypothetical protein
MDAGSGVVVATDRGPATIPVAGGRLADLTDPSGRRVRTRAVAGGVTASLVPGVRYTIAVSGAAIG